MFNNLTYGGWFGQGSGTGAGFSPIAAKTLVVGAALAILAAVGTGGSMTPTLYKGVRHHDSQNHTERNRQLAPLVADSVVDNLKNIKSIFSPSVADLAFALGVSRQTVYNWMAGELPKLEYAEKILTLAHAAEAFREKGIKFNSLLLKRKFFNGQSLFEVAQSGGPIIEAANILISVIDREMLQRAKVKGAFEGRPLKSAGVDFDLPSANSVVR